MGCTSCGGGVSNGEAFRTSLSETRQGPMTGVHVRAGPVSLLEPAVLRRGPVLRSGLEMQGRAAGPSGRMVEAGGADSPGTAASGQVGGGEGPTIAWPSGSEHPAPGTDVSPSDIRKLVAAVRGQRMGLTEAQHVSTVINMLLELEWEVDADGARDFGQMLATFNRVGITQYLVQLGALLLEAATLLVSAITPQATSNVACVEETRRQHDPDCPAKLKGPFTCWRTKLGCRTRFDKRDNFLMDWYGVCVKTSWKVKLANGECIQYEGCKCLPRVRIKVENVVLVLALGFLAAWLLPGISGALIKLAQRIAPAIRNAGKAAADLADDIAKGWAPAGG